MELSNTNEICNWEIELENTVEKIYWEIQLRESIGKYSWEIQLGNTVKKFNWEIQLRISIGKYSWEIQFGNRVEKCICQHIGTVLGINREHTTMVAAPHHCAQSYTHNINFDNQQSYTTTCTTTCICKLLGIWSIYMFLIVDCWKKGERDKNISADQHINAADVYNLMYQHINIGGDVLFIWKYHLPLTPVYISLISKKKYNDTNPRSILLNKIYQKLVHYRCTRCNLCQVLHFS